MQQTQAGRGRGEAASTRQASKSHREVVWREVERSEEKRGKKYVKYEAFSQRQRIASRRQSSMGPADAGGRSKEDGLGRNKGTVGKSSKGRTQVL